MSSIVTFTSSLTTIGNVYSPCKNHYWVATVWYMLSALNPILRFTEGAVPSSHQTVKRVDEFLLLSNLKMSAPGYELCCHDCRCRRYRDRVANDKERCCGKPPSVITRGVVRGHQLDVSMRATRSINIRLAKVVSSGLRWRGYAYSFPGLVFSSSSSSCPSSSSHRLLALLALLGLGCGRFLGPGFHDGGRWRCCHWRDCRYRCRWCLVLEAAEAVGR